MYLFQVVTEKATIKTPITKTTIPKLLPASEVL